MTYSNKHKVRYKYMPTDTDYIVLRPDGVAYTDFSEKLTRKQAETIANDLNAERALKI